MTKKLILITLLLSLISIPAKANSCNLTYLQQSNINVKKLGTINTQMLFIKYPDSPKKPKGYIKDYLNTLDMEEMKNYVKESSYKKAKLKLNITTSWINMPNVSYTYGVQGMMTEQEEDTFRDAIVSASISKIKPDTDIIWIVSDPDFAPYMMAFRNPANINGKNITLIMYNQQNPWLAVSELFHGLGLRDVYSSIGLGPSGGMDQFSLMAQYNAGTDLSGYEKYTLGWLGSNDFICQESGSNTYKLNPLGNKGLKLILLPLNSQEMLGIEYRKKEKRDKYIGGSGIIVYHIDSTWKQGSPMNLLFFGKKGNVNFANISININKDTITVTR